MSSLSSLTIHRPAQSSYVAVIARVAAAAVVRFNGFELHEVLIDRCAAARTRALLADCVGSPRKSIPSVCGSPASPPSAIVGNERRP
ncbi:hypothetical protein C8E89_13413 [Mycolicibacterium moriokaense]|uniref:Uncharacterized protein n=1 Tax=Mycolicibacterium moriokaense TaxID=39691 RepID=A0A318HER4_9MYCO|nr:hypothetical protein C8E89_13413 [Mycolicibacterium moriokaense]